MAPSAEKRGHRDRRWHSRGPQSDVSVIPPGLQMQEPRCSRCQQQGTDRQIRGGHICSRRGQRGCSRFDRNTQESSGSVHSADRGEAWTLANKSSKGRGRGSVRRRGRCDEGITDKVPVGERTQRRCAEVAAFAGGSSRTAEHGEVPPFHRRRKPRSTNCAPPSRICNAREIGCDQRCPANASKKVVRWSSQ